MDEVKGVHKEEKLLRWLHPGQFNWQEKRPTSAAFTDDYMSVDILSLTAVEESYNRAKQYGKNAVASIRAKFLYEKEQKICHCPTRILQNSPQTTVCITDVNCKIYRDNISTDETTVINPAHACVIGKKTKSISKFLAKNSQVEIYPPAEI